MTSTTPNSIVLTGCGWVTPIAVGTVRDVLSAVSSESAPSSSSGFLSVPDDPPPADLSHLSNETKRNKGAWMAALAVEHACRTAALPLESLDSDRVGLTLGCGMAGQLGMIDFASEVRTQSVRFVSPIHFPQTVGNYVAGALARGYKLRGPNATFASGPASSLNAIVEACAIVARGGADIVLAGGVEHLSADLAEGIEQDGTFLSEGACFFVVERADGAAKRSAKTMASVTGWRCGDMSADSAIVSVAGCRLGGAVLIEQVVGLCIGAAGAAAVAAAIGAVGGDTVPTCNSSDPSVISTQTIKAVESDGRVSATIIAPSESMAQDNCVHLDLSILHSD